MNITVVGGNSGSGAQVVRLAAEAGHAVTCLSRRGSANGSGRVRDLAGNATDPGVVRSAVEGADAVVITVGGAAGADRNRAEVTASIIAAMKAEQEAAVEASGLDWTIVRPGGLTDDPATGSYVAQTTAEGRRMKNRIGRADVAAYILSILEDPTSYGKALAMGTL